MARLPFLALAAAALLPLSANAQEAQPSLGALVVTATERLCLPLLTSQLDINVPAAMQTVAGSIGMTFGISQQQLDLFTPPADAALARSALFSGQSGDQQFLMSVGGAERTCRIYVQQAGQTTSDDLVRQFYATGIWQEQAMPAGASPRRGFLKGTVEQPEAAAIILLGEQLPGIAYSVVILPL